MHFLYSVVLLVIVAFLSSCKAITNIGGYSSWNLNYKYSTSIITHPARPEDKKIYVSITDISGNSNAFDTEAKVKKELTKKGFTVNKDPNKAKYRLIANVRLFRKIPFNDLETIMENWNMELSDAIAGENLIRQKNINKIENEIAKYTNHETPSSLKLTIDEQSNKSNRTIGQIIEAYKNFDISGIILGSTVGFLTNSPKNVILGGVYGGFLFEIAARATNPKSYLLVIDVEISEPRCVSFDSSINQSDSNESTTTKNHCADVKEFDKRIYKQDDYSYRRVEFSRENEYITYRTTIYATSAKIFASREKSTEKIFSSIPQMLSSSIR